MKHKFYHGTSSFFLNSIKTNGLGGIVPSVDYKLLELLRHLFDLSEVHLKNDVEYLKIKDTTKVSLL